MSGPKRTWHDESYLIGPKSSLSQKKKISGGEKKWNISTDITIQPQSPVHSLIWYVTVRVRGAPIHLVMYRVIILYQGEHCTKTRKIKSLIKTGSWMNHYRGVTIVSKPRLKWESIVSHSLFVFRSISVLLQYVTTYKFISPWSPITLKVSNSQNDG